MTMSVGPQPHTPDDWAAAKALAEGGEVAESEVAETVEPEPEPEVAESADADDDELETEAPEPEPDQKVPNSEWAKFRTAKRDWRRQRDTQAREIETARAETKKSFGDERKARELLDNGEVEEAIELLAKRPFQDVMKDVVERAKGRDPDTRKLRRELQERDAREKVEREKVAATQQEQTQQANEARLIRSHVVEPLKKTSGPAAKLAENPIFNRMVFRELADSFDPETRTTISLDEAVAPAIERFRGMYDTLAEAFGSPTPTKSEPGIRGAASPENGHRSAASSAKQRPPGRGNRRAAGEASKRGGSPTSDEWFAEAEAALKNANANAPDAKD